MGIGDAEKLESFAVYTDIYLKKFIQGGTNKAKSKRQVCAGDLEGWVAGAYIFLFPPFFLFLFWFFNWCVRFFRGGEEKREREGVDSETW